MLIVTLLVLTMVGQVKWPEDSLAIRARANLVKLDKLKKDYNQTKVVIGNYKGLLVGMGDKKVPIFSVGGVFTDFVEPKDPKVAVQKKKEIESVVAEGEAEMEKAIKGVLEEMKWKQRDKAVAWLELK